MSMIPYARRPGLGRSRTIRSDRGFRLLTLSAHDPPQPHRNGGRGVTDPDFPKDCGAPPRCSGLVFRLGNGCEGFALRTVKLAV